MTVIFQLTREPSRAKSARTWPQRIAARLEPALGDVLADERSRLHLHLSAVADSLKVSDSHYGAIENGERQTNLTTFIALAWTLGQDPRELLNKMLLRMGYPPGTRLVIGPQRTPLV